MVVNKLTIILFVLFLFGFSMIFVARKAYKAGQESVQLQWAMALEQETDKKLTVKEKQDEIQNAPVDVDVTIKRLRDGTF